MQVPERLASLVSTGSHAGPVVRVPAEPGRVRMKARAPVNAYTNTRLGPSLVEACRKGGVDLELDVADAGYVGRLDGVWTRSAGQRRPAG